MKDLYAENKNHSIGPLYGSVENNLTYFKKIKKQNDYIIKIDNTSINNRPDLLSHRGLGRELGLLFNKKMILESNLIFNKKNIKKENKLFTITSPSVIGAGAISGVFHERESFLSYILDMVPLDITPHSYLIDLSNYVMLDYGQPLHVFDAQKINTPLQFTDTIKGSLECIDNTIIEIEKQHTVITENNKIHSLVGIMGGKFSSVTIKTKEILIESAAIKKEAIIHTAKTYQKKTESVIRNEKGSSPEAVEYGLLRFLKLINTDFTYNPIEYQFSTHYTKNIKSDKISLSLQYMTKVIGILIEYTLIEKIFLGLGFSIIKNSNDSDITIEIPWWRKDISNEDDLIEEIVRHIGYDTLPLTPPQLECKGIIKDDSIDALKKNTVLLTLAQEIISYGISNEEQKNKWSFVSNQSPVILKNPYSDRQKNMANSVLPNFLDIIQKELQRGITEISLFEINPLWHIESQSNIKEELYYTYSHYEQSTDYDFYTQSQLIKKVFYDLDYDFNFISINKSNLRHNLFSDIAGHIHYHDTLIGICGFIDPLKLYKENKKNGSVFAAEINLSLLTSLKKVPPLNHKYPFFDISILIQKTIKIESITLQLQIAFGGIMHIKIIDWFESAEWNNNRSITMRIFLMNNNTNELYTEIKKYLIERDCTVR